MKTDEFIFSNKKTKSDDEDYEDGPKYFDDFVGHEKIIRQLKIAIDVSNRLEKPLDHILFRGPPGMGKTTLAQLLAKAKGGRFVMKIGTHLQYPDDVEEIIFKLERGDIFFIDEIHGMSYAAQEALYHPMQEYRIENKPVAHFTLIGATTEQGKLNAPLKDRFGIQINVPWYNKEEIDEILRRLSLKKGMIIDEETISKIQPVCRQNPRVANRILRRIKEYSIYNNGHYDHKNLDIKEKRRLLVLHYHPDRNRSFDAEEKFKEIQHLYEKNDDAGLKKLLLEIPITIYIDDVDKTLDMMDIDENGLEEMHRKYLCALAEYFLIPLGVKRISPIIQESITTIEKDIEPWLYHLKFIQFTPQGRILSQRALLMKKYGLEEMVKEYHNGIVPIRRGMEKVGIGISQNRSKNDEILDSLEPLPNRRGHRGLL